MSKLAITLTKSINGAQERQIKTIEALGLKKIGQQVIHEDNAAIRGMLRKVDHMVTWEEA